MTQPIAILNLYLTAGKHPTSGLASYAYLITNIVYQKYLQNGQCIGTSTNKQAHIKGIVAGMKSAKKYNPKEGYFLSLEFEGKKRIDSCLINFLSFVKFSNEFGN